MSVPPQQSSVAPPIDAPPPGVFRKTFQAFHYRNFRLMWSGAFTSTTGSFVQEVAQSWLVYQLTNDPLLLGLVIFLNNAPILMFSLLGGVAADRMDRRKLLIVSQIVQMSSAAALAALIWIGHIEIWHILAAAFVTGTGQAFGGPAYQALIPSLIAKKDLPNAIALMSIQFNLAAVIGRPIGGFAAKIFGAAACFGINAASFLVVIGTLLALPRGYAPEKQQQRVWQSLREGVSHVFDNKATLGLVMLAVATAFLGVPLMGLLPVFAKDVFGLGEVGFGALGGAFGAGGVVGALVVAWLGNRERKGRRAVMTQISLGLSVFAFGAVSNLTLAPILLFLAGGSLLAFFASVNSLVQLQAPENMRGRIMSVYNTAFRGSMALGPVVAGALARDYGAPLVVAVEGALLVVIGVWFMATHRAVREL